MLIAELLYRLPGSKDIIKVPVGFKTDFASVPRAMRWLITGQDDTRKPAVVHDYLYRRRVGARDWADCVPGRDEGRGCFPLEAVDLLRRRPIFRLAGVW